MKTRPHLWLALASFLAAFAVYSGLALATPHGQARYKVIDLGTLGGSFSEAFSVNSVAQVAGTSTTTNDATTHAFLWSKGRIHDLGNLPGGSTSGAAAVNLFGQVAGESDNENASPNPFLCFTPNECRAFLWQNGKMKDLGTLRGGNNSAGGWINDFGIVVGASEFTNSIDPANGFTPVHATAWVLDVPIDLGTLGGPISSANSINDLGQIAGISQFNRVINPNTGIPSFHGFLFDRGRMIDLSTGGGLGGDENEGIAINDNRQIVGDADLPGDTGTHAFVWQNGVMNDLGTLDGDSSSSAQAIDDTGRIVGWSGDGESVFRAALWKSGSVTDLNTLVPANTDLYLLIATGTNLDGTIAGLGVSQSTGEFHGFLLIPSGGSASTDTNAAEPVTVEDATHSRTPTPIRVTLPYGLQRLAHRLTRTHTRVTN
jgi:probable HAF family extracellular repeat protein